MKKLILTLALAALNVSVVSAQAGIWHQPPTAFGPVHTIHEERFVIENKNGKPVKSEVIIFADTTFSRDKTRIEYVESGSIKQVFLFSPQGKLLTDEILEMDGRPRGTKSVFTYDSLGRQSEIVHYLLGSFSYRETFSYPQKGNSVDIKRVFDSGGRETETDFYDDQGRIIETRTHDSEGTSKELCKYDAKGNLIEYLLYDARGRMADKQVHEYEFDSHGNWTKQRTMSWDWDTGKAVRNPVRLTERTITYYDSPQ